MPHSLYLGSGIVQPRLIEYDVNNGHLAPPNPEEVDDTQDEKQHPHQPSIFAIKACLGYSTAELGISLFTFALFVNSAIVITAGASLYGKTSAEDASLFSIHELLSTSIGSIAGTIFALALLFSGVSAGIVCTIAGQMVSEGALNWKVRPWLRRLITRSISITPSIIIAGAVGKDGLSAALNGTQVALSIALPFVSAPIIYFTCRNKYMSTPAVSPHTAFQSSTSDNNNPAEHRALVADDKQTTAQVQVLGHVTEPSHQMVNLRNHWLTTTIAILIWIIITVLNVANIVLLGLGK
jgi:metal iron transporter